jgi:hypothetical protein
LSNLCVLPHDEDAEALPALRLCRAHRRRLEHDLADLPRLHAELGDALTPGSSGGGYVTIGGGIPTGRGTDDAGPLAIHEGRLPINPAVAEHRDQIKHDLVTWCLFVADQRGLTKLPADTVPDIAKWLLPHVEWIAGHASAAVECPPVMRELVGRARGLLDPKRKLPTGERCRMAPDGAERCAGLITMVQASDETWSARCSVCGPQEAAPYLHDRAAGRWVTIERVRAYALRAHGVRAERATIRSWAARQRVTTTTTDGVTWYDLGSVQRYLSERGKMAG